MGTWLALLALGLAAILALTVPTAAQVVKRLILTDGSYQLATQWKREGDRVRYYSSERGEWEEVPASLVDWKATQAWNAETRKAETDELKVATAGEIAARKEAMLNTPQVAPNLDPSLRLPPEGGVFLLETLDGKAVLQQVQGNALEEHSHELEDMIKRSVIPLSSRLQTLELKGSAARVKVRPGASIFVDVEDDQGPIAGDEFRIVRLESKHGRRVVAKNKVGMRGEISVKENYVEAKAEKFSGDWWRLIPLEELTPGQYAVAIAEDQASGEVWDFAVQK